jgi:GT2 family glycosyltransferase
LSQPLVAIVILNWNGRKYLEQFLPSVSASTYPSAKIIVADNASADDSVTFLQKHYPEVGIIRLPQNYGFARGYNEALKQVNADYYVLLNSDVEVTPGWIEPVIALMQANPSIAVCQPKLLAWHQKDHFEYAGAAGGWLDRYGYPFARGRVFDHCEQDKGQYNDAVPVFWASGAAMFVTAAVYHKVGGLDEFFFAHQEEIDFCWRVQLAGYSIYVQPESVVYHVGGGTLPKGNARKVFLNFRNNLIMLVKNLPLQKSLLIVPFRLSLDAVFAWKSLFTGDGTSFMAVIKAHIAFVKWIFSTSKASLRPAQKNALLKGRYPGNIVWQYFIRRRKTFVEIVKNKN